ncbi:MAG TPA: hypothetical protein VHX42_05360 [Candidatus Babeliales bacterium]|jgi:hypothetical protein|nr:hypothetical protein [Candidatus Babeliales bacterium]
MQKIYINLIMLFILSNVTSMSHALTIYLRNNYGAPIEYVQATRETVRSQPTDLPAIKVGNGSQEEIRLFFYLFIRSIGGSYYDISYVFRDILEQQPFHYGDDAVIVIYPRQGLSGTYYWNIQIEWERPESIFPLRKKTIK